MELHRESGASPGTTTVLAVVGHDHVATIRGDGPVVALAVLLPDRVGRTEARSLVDTAVELAAESDARAASVLVASDAMVRHEAVLVGAHGPLRGALRLPHVGGDLPAVAFVDAVAALLPGCDVRTRRSILRTLDLRVASPTGGAVRVRLPRDAEPMSEPVAAAVDTVLAVKARFGRAASGIAALSFDSGGMALSTGDVAGQAEGGSGVVVLSPNFVAADLLEQERWARTEAGRRTRPAPADERPCRTLDEVVAHECWHYLDAEIRVSGTAYVEFNRALGVPLGVESLELALRGRERDAPEAWRVALARLVEEVSLYASTSPREATAEMFSRWWCGAASPVVTRFGELVEQYFPRVP